MYKFDKYDKPHTIYRKTYKVIQQETLDQLGIRRKPIKMFIFRYTEIWILYFNI